MVKGASSRQGVLGGVVLCLLFYSLDLATESLQTSWESDSQACLALMQDEDVGHLNNSN